MELLKDWVPAGWPETKLLAGTSIRLEALHPLKHGESLWQSTGGLHRSDLWLYMADGPFAQRADFDEATKRAAESLDPVHFAIVDQQTDLAIGRCSLLNIRPAHGVIEIGHLLFSERLQRTRGATEVLYLLAKYSFDQLGYRRFEWKCNSLNAKSRQAAGRFGFVFEGVFRQHMVIKGCNRDTAWFAMLDGDWPRVRGALEQWLSTKNFDENGKQRCRLSDLLPSIPPS